MRGICFRALVHVWSSGDNLLELVLSYHVYLGVGNGEMEGEIKLRSSDVAASIFYLLSHLTGPLERYSEGLLSCILVRLLSPDFSYAIVYKTRPIGDI